MNTAEAALEAAPFFDMADRYKVLTPETPAAITRMADDLSALVAEGTISAYYQVSVHGQEVFTVACR